MNIFVTDPDPVKSAEVLPDKHVVKMPLETCQMLVSFILNGILTGVMTYYRRRMEHHTTQRKVPSEGIHAPSGQHKIYTTLLG